MQIDIFSRAKWRSIIHYSKEDCSDALMVHRSTTVLYAVFGPQRAGATAVVGGPTWLGCVCRVCAV